jgi:hypothetical protein
MLMVGTMKQLMVFVGNDGDGQRKKKAGGWIFL